MGITKTDFILYVRSLVNQSVDTDGWYGAQCVDLITHVQKKFWNFWGQGHAVNFATNALPANWTRGHHSQMGVQPGDILVWKWGSTDVYGHIGICVEAVGGMVTSVEQNVDGNPAYGGPARYRTRDLGACISVLRPNFDGQTSTQTVVTQTKEYAESGTFTLTVDSINVRRAPNTSETPVAVYYKGQSLQYDRVRIDANGYVWISYVGASSGKRNWMATGATRNGVRYGERWGTFK